MRRRYKPILAGISWLLVFTTSISLLRWDISDLSVTVLNPKKTEAQSASQTTFYFKSDIRTATGAFGVTGPTAEFSSDTSEEAVSGSTTAYTMAPVAGPVTNAVSDTSDNIVVTEAVNDTAHYMWVRTFIMPLAINTVFNGDSTTFKVGMSFDESNPAANMLPRYYVYVYDSVDNHMEDMLAGPTSGVEAGATDQGRITTVTNTIGASTTYTSDNNDFLAVEVWLLNDSNATSRSCTVRWGGNVVVAEDTANLNPASYLTIGGTTVDTSDPIYFTNTSVPPEPGPNASQTGDSFETSTLDARRMSTVPGSGVEANIHTTTTTGSGSYNYRMNTFISPPLAAQTIPAGVWLIHVHGTTDNAAVNAQLRGMIYTWDADDTIGDTIIAVANSGTNWISGVNNSQIEMTWSGSAATISAGERLVAEWNFVTINPGANTAGVAHRFGDNPATPSATLYDSCVMPPMNYASSPAALSWRAAIYEQTSYWFDEDNDDETHDAWTDKNGAIAIDTAATYDASTTVNFRLRIQIRNNGTESDTLQPKLEYRVNSPPGSWIEITTSAAPIKIRASDQFADATVTTRQLTDQTGYDFTAGEMEETGSPAGDTTMIRWNFTEYEWSLIGSGATKKYDIRANDNGSAFDTYPVTQAAVTINGYTPKINNWQWYADEINATPLTAYAAENTAPPQIEMGKSIPLKLRINLTETAGVGENDSRKVLQFGTDQVNWTNVGSTSDTLFPFRYYSGGGGDDNVTLPSALLNGSDPDYRGIHNESNSNGPSFSDHRASTTTEFEYCIENYSADANTIYYFNIRDEILVADIPLGSGKSYPSLRTAASYDLTVSAPSAVYLGSWQIGSSPYHSYTFDLGEEITIRDNRGVTGGNSAGWSCTAAVTTELYDGDSTITKDNMYWISDSITGLYAAPITNIATQSGDYMDAAVTAASVAGSGKDGLGGFTQLPTIRIYNAKNVGDYAGSITITLT